MAIRLEFISLIVPVRKIDKYYPGGFKTFIAERISMFGGKLWYDNYLFRDGAMSPMDMEGLVKFWEGYGLIPVVERNGQKCWQDMCVVDFCGGPNLPCDWLEYDPSDQSVFLKSKSKGEVIGREEMEEILNIHGTNSNTLNNLFQHNGVRINRGALFDKVVSSKPPAFDFGRVEGMLLGIAIGDALGVTTEGMLPNRRRLKYGELRDYIPNKYVKEAKGYPSDDTQLAFWTLEQLIEDKKFVPENVAARFASRGRIFGIGLTVRNFLANFKAGKPWFESGPKSAGNGTLMRIAPILIPHLKTGGKNIWVDTALAAMMTHNDYASTSACLAFVAMLWELMDMPGAPDPQWWVERYVQLAKDLEGEPIYSPRGGRFSAYAGPLWRFIQEKLLGAYMQKLSVEQACSDWYSGAYLLETLPSALYILMCHAHEPEEALVRAVNDTKDNDTIAAIVGAALGAMHGKDAFPKRWINGLSGRISQNDDGRVFDLIVEARDIFWEKISV